MTKSKEKTDTIATMTDFVDEVTLFERVTETIENRKYRAQAAANSEVTLMFWEVGRLINQAILENKRAAYGR